MNQGVGCLGPGSGKGMCQLTSVEAPLAPAETTRRLNHHARAGTPQVLSLPSMVTITSMKFS
ncbi:putative Secreted protein [Pseudomonas sp. IT-P294]